MDPLVWQFVDLTPAQRADALSRLTPAQLVTLARRTIAAKQQQQRGLSGLSGFFDSLLGSIGGLLGPASALIPGIGPIISPILTVVGGALTNRGGGSIAPVTQTPPPPQLGPPAPAPSSGFQITPTVLIAGAAFLFLMLDRRR